MTKDGKPGKPKTGFPPFPPFLEIAMRFPQCRRSGDETDGKVENQNQVSHFPTATNILLGGKQTKRC